jgi:predicted Zn-dependent protease
MPDHAGARFNLALAYAALGRLDDAERAFAEGRQLQPDNAAAHNGFGMMLRDRGEPTRALPYLEAAVAARPDQPEFRYDLAVALQMANRLPAALDAFQEVVRQGPTDARYLAGLARALNAAGDTIAANERYAEAFRLDPEWADRSDQEAWRLAVHPEKGQRNGIRAVRLGEEACQATGFARADFVDTLAAAYAEANRFPEAVETARRAVGLATDPRLVTEIGERLSLFESGRPFRARLAPEPAPADGR